MEGSDEPEDVQTLRRQVEEKYDFDNFGPADMAEMTPEEWDAAFDPETWITGPELLDRVEADLRQRIADRDVFARLERQDGRLLAYSDTGYAVVSPDGSVEGEGTVLRDVEPTVALCSMADYDVPESPPEDALPEPQDVPQGSGQLGNNVLQAVAGAQILAGLALLGAWLLSWLNLVSLSAQTGSGQLNTVLLFVGGAGFVLIGLFLFLVVANARLSDRYRAEEFRNRLRAVELEEGERPSFLPDDDDT
ncbi:hypothetical protein VB779_01425 [Haloarculaceae archaeon H-GB11]|nr:hypothetical protein [Haloarculaceae archaeon H-GB11]